MLRRPRSVLALTIGIAAALALAACSSSSSSSSSGPGSTTITVAYENFGAVTQVNQFFQQIVPQFEKANPGVTVRLEPIQAAENDYYTKLDLMLRSPSTAPDVAYEDTFLINSDVSAGYLRPLDSYLDSWSDWSQFYPAAQAAARGADGKTYGVPMGTDTRAIWYNKDIFRQAGLPVPWQPKTWADILAAARQIKAKVPGVVPFNVYSGEPVGEAATMQGFEMLLYGTGVQLYDAASNKWVAPGTPFTDSLDFVHTVFSQGLAPSVQDALNPNFFTVVEAQWLPEGKLAMDLDGSWLPSVWQPGGSRTWPAWSTTMGVAAMPTQNGQAPGATSMSGGWTLAISKQSSHPSAAWKFISFALNEQNSATFDRLDSQLAVRKDVAASAEYKTMNPMIGFFTGLVDYTHYRPAFAAYPRISDAIQTAMESVMTGQQTPAAATATYAQSLTSIVGSASITGSAPG